jgi:hypothetical protein
MLVWQPEIFFYENYAIEKKEHFRSLRSLKRISPFLGMDKIFIIFS